MAKKKRAKRAVTRGIIAAIVLALIIGLYLGMPGFGVGEGSGNNSGIAAAATADANGGGPIDEMEELTQTGLQDNVLVVLIDGWEYLVQTTRAGEKLYRSSKLTEITRLAKLAKGNEVGIRVRVYRKRSARADAEDELRTALAQARVPSETVSWGAEPGA